MVVRDKSVRSFLVARWRHWSLALNALLATMAARNRVKRMCLICNGTVAVVKSSRVKIEALQNNGHGTVWREVLAKVCSKKRKSSAGAE